MHFMQPLHKRAWPSQDAATNNQLAKDQEERSSEPSRAAALTALDARGWTRLVHLSQAKKRFLEIVLLRMPVR